jgi:hypothetical protein
MRTSTDRYFMKIIFFLHYNKAICYIKSLIKQLRYQIPNEKIWSQMKSGKETTRKPSVRERNDNLCSRGLLRKEKLAWESVKKNGKKKTAEAKGKQRLVFTTLCTNDTVAIQVEV